VQNTKACRKARGHRLHPVTFRLLNLSCSPSAVFFSSLYMPIFLNCYLNFGCILDVNMPEQSYISPADGNEVFQAKYIPKQKAPPASDSPSMKAYISTFPSLGQVTQIDKNTSVFTALLEVDEGRAKDLWKVSLWHSDGGEWREVPMEPVIKSQCQPISLQGSKSNSKLHKLYFTTPLAIHLPTNFTIKFRNSSEHSWQWVKDHQGTQDGIVMLKTVTTQSAISTNLEDYVQDLNPTLQFKNYRSQSPGTILWSVEASIEAANGAKSTTKDIKFGVPWGYQKFSR
jgi:hypothetical protein